MLDMHSSISNVVNHCHSCAALKLVPSRFSEQSTSVDIERIGAVFGADVMRESGQFILVLRESISSYTTAMIIPSEKADSLRDGLISLVSSLRSSMSPPATIRTDPASGLRSLVNDSILKSMNLVVQLGDAKNLNKNPVAEKAIEELRAEIVRIQPSGGKISTPILARSLLNLNSRIRKNKLSSFEIWTQREMSTGNQISFSDEAIVKDKISQRLSNHDSSAKYKARGKSTEVKPTVEVGDIVYLWEDRSKSKSRNRYLIVELDTDGFVQVQKFSGMQLRARKYRVKPSDIYTVQSDIPSPEPSQPDSSQSLPYTEPVHIPVLSREFKRQKNRSKKVPRPPSPDSSSSDEHILSDLLPSSAENRVTEPEVHQAENRRSLRNRQEPQRFQIECRPTRVRRPPAHLRYYVLGNTTALPDSDSDELAEPSDNE